MRMHRYTFYAIAGGLSLLLVLLIIVNFGGSKESQRDRGWKYVKNYAQQITDRNYDIICFGDDLGLPQEFRVRQVLDLNEYSIESDAAPNNHVGHIIILYDPNDTHFLTEDQVQYLKGGYESGDFRIIAVGAGKIRMLENAGLCSSGTADTTSSIMLWKNHSGATNSYPGIAGDRSLIPQSIEAEIDPKSIPAYSLMMELGTKELLWS